MKKQMNSYFSLVLVGLCLTITTPGCHQKSKKSTERLHVIESIPIDSVTSDFPVGFQFITVDGWQFMAYYNKNRNLTVASRNISDKKLSYKVLPTRVGWDSHNRIILTLDSKKCVHVCGNMHNDSLTYFITEKPCDISTFRKVFPMVAAKDELSCTYPGFTKTGANNLIFSYRKGGSGNGITISNIYDENTSSFKRLTDKPLFDGLGEMSAYVSGPRMGPDSMFHMVWVWRDTPGCETNHDISYARSSDLIHWESMDGTSMELPITPYTKQFTVDPVPARGGAINGGSTLFFNKDNKPLIAFMKYDSEGNSQIYLARTYHKQWVVNQISDWDYRWNFSGPGSINSEINLNRGEVKPDGKIAIRYWHIKKGNGELLVEKGGERLLQDMTVNATEEESFPSELNNPVSDIYGMSVRWIKSRSSADQPNVYYALRWETLGKRRFYEPREEPVKASEMILYKFSKE